MRNSVRCIAAFIILCLLMTSTFFLSTSTAQAQWRHRTQTKTTYGKKVEMGHGQLRTFVTLNGAKEPQAVGVHFTANALNGLPTAPSDGNWDIIDESGETVWFCCGHETVLRFPRAIRATPFSHFVLNWNPAGHPPPHVYHVPHFDFHFYTQAQAAQMAIAAPTAEERCLVPNPAGGEPAMVPAPLDCELLARATAPLPSDQMPPGYVNANAVEPSMGNHLINPTAPEFMGETFTHTWIYGAYDGEITFFEPMMTKAFIETHRGESCFDISMPEALPEAGWYPTQYCIRYLDQVDVYEISLEAFAEFPQSVAE